MTTTVKRPRKKQDMWDKLDKMKREREKFDQEEKEFEERKEKYAKLTNPESDSSATPNSKSASDSSTSNEKSSDSSPEETTTSPGVDIGREVFFEDKRYQHFTFEELVPNKNDPVSCLSSTRMLFQLRVSPLTDVSNETLKQLFYLMSVDDDCIFGDYCCYYLIERVQRWFPEISQIIEVFTNWGATYESLGMQKFDIKLVYRYCTPKTHDRTDMKDELPSFHNFNYEHIFTYLKAVIPRSKEDDYYSEMEILLLMRIFIKMSMDQRFPRLVDLIKKTKLVYTCVETIQDWNHTKVISIARCIYDKKESLKNLMFVVTRILSKLPRCNELRMCLAFVLLRQLILKEKQKPSFKYPYEDEEFLELVQRINTDHVAPEDMPSLYLIIKLIHICIHGRGMLEAERMAIVEEVQICLEQVKIALSQQPNNFDADLLTGQISACTAVWTLFSKRDDLNYSLSQ